MRQKPTPPRFHSLREGALVAGRYRVLEKIGEGTFCSVYRVEQVERGNILALKVLAPDLMAPSTLAPRFEREARALARLDHPNIVHLVEVGTDDDGLMFMALELLEGISLSEWAAPPARVPLATIAEILGQVLEALDHAHARGVVHRDLKPHNVMIDEVNGKISVRLYDFGVAKILGETREEESELSRPGTICGTPQYMSPEQITQLDLDGRTDLYATGVMLYELVTGRVPFVGSAAEILSKHLSSPPPPVFSDELDADTAVRLENIVSRALAKRAEDRFRDAREFRWALEELEPPARARRRARGAYGQAQHEKPKKASSRKRSRAPGWGSFLGAIAAAALAFGGAFWAYHKSQGLELDPIEGAQRSLAAGDLTRARSLAELALGQNPDDARAHLLAGDIAITGGDEDAGVASFARAIDLDVSIAGHTRFAAHARRLMLAESTTKPVEALAFELTVRGDASAIPLLFDLAEQAGSGEMRRHAWEGLERLGATAKVDAVAYLMRELLRVDGGPKSCETRKWYVTRLGVLGDRGALPALEREQARRARGAMPFAGSDPNGCMRRELETYLAALDTPKTGRRVR